MDIENEINPDYLVWYWDNGNRICGPCGWMVIAEKEYYWCIGCNRTVDKSHYLFGEGFLK